MGGIPNRKNMDGTPRVFVSVKLEKSVVDRARVVAAWKKVSVGDYLSDAANNCIEADEAAMIASMGGGNPGKGGGNPGRGGGNPGKPGGKHAGDPDPAPTSLPDGPGPRAVYPDDDPMIRRITKAKKKGRPRGGDGLSREI